MLSLLDLSAAFDTVDHHSLLQRLRTSYGLCGVVLKWFTSYLTDRTQFVRTSATASLPLPVVHGVPQGSVLGAMFFSAVRRLSPAADKIDATSWFLMRTHTTRRSTASVDHVTLTSSPTQCLPVQTRCCRG